MLVLEQFSAESIHHIDVDGLFVVSLQCCQLVISNTYIVVVDNFFAGQMEKIELGLVIYNKKGSQKLHFQVAEMYKKCYRKNEKGKIT
jgi:hypothetical protein